MVKLNRFYESKTCVYQLCIEKERKKKPTTIHKNQSVSNPRSANSFKLVQSIAWFHVMDLENEFFLFLRPATALIRPLRIYFFIGIKMCICWNKWKSAIFGIFQFHNACDDRLVVKSNAYMFSKWFIKIVSSLFFSLLLLLRIKFFIFRNSVWTDALERNIYLAGQMMLKNKRIITYIYILFLFYDRLILF